MVGALLLLMVPKWEITLNQTFDGPKGQAPDAKVWGRDIGGGGYGNNELQSYTDGNANAFLDGEGHLIIEARKEPTKGPDGIARDYSSARLQTKGRFEQRYGKMEARMRLPKGQGIWPAFWMLGADIDKTGWPRCGEIDVLEFIGREPKTVYATLHGPGYSNGGEIQGKTLSNDLSEAFHNYAVEWSPERIVWTFDGKPYHKVEAKDVDNKEWPFEKPQFLILNLAVGGYWPKYPDATTVFPQRLVVEHVKVWRDANLKVDEDALERRHKERMAAPPKIPGVVRLADYVGYKDSDATNEGKAYRTDGVDLGASGLGEAPYSVGWTRAGEWLEYDLDVVEPGNYKVEMMVASEGAGGTIELLADGAVFATVNVPDTGGWTNWKPIPAGVASLKAGRHKLRVVMKSANAGGSVGNAALLRFTKG